MLLIGMDFNGELGCVKLEGAEREFVDTPVGLMEWATQIRMLSWLWSSAVRRTWSLPLASSAAQQDAIGHCEWQVADNYSIVHKCREYDYVLIS